MGIEAAAQQMVILFIGIAIGFILSKKGMLTDKGSKVVTSIVMSITLPCFILESGLTGDLGVTGQEMFNYFLLSLVCYAIAYILGLLLSRLPMFPKNDRRLYCFMTTFGNTGFIGLPVIGALFGSEAVFYATVFNLPFNFLVFTIGIVLVSSEANFKNVNPRKFFNGCLVASVLAIVFYITNISVPDVVVSCLDTFGAATVPLAMIITGASLSKEKPRDVFAKVDLYLVSLVKVLIVPAVSFVILSLVLDNQTLVGVGVVLMAMPVASNATLLCVQYGGNDRLASRGVFLSTILSVITIPLFVIILGG